MDFGTFIYVILQDIGGFVASHGKLFGAFLVGMLGSGAYITALYFRFIGVNSEQRDIIMEPFRERYFFGGLSTRKCLFYCSVGGAIAVVFQFDVPNFVAVQSLILGATWPAVVSQFLSGRMVNLSKEEIDALTKPSVPINTDLEKKIRGISRGNKKK